MKSIPNQIKFLRKKEKEFWGKWLAFDDNRRKEMERLKNEINPYSDKHHFYGEKRIAMLKEFTKELREKGMTYGEIGKMVSHTAAEVFYIAEKRGNTLTRYEREKIRNKNGNKCKVCESENNLQIHHIFKANDNRRKNLMLLCAKCHHHLHQIKRGDTEKYKEYIKAIVG